MSASLAALDPRAPLPQVMIGDPEYYGRFWGFTNAWTAGWDAARPVRARRLLVRCDESAAPSPPKERHAGALAALTIFLFPSPRSGIARRNAL
jgi:predicted N-acetyltransferase YhbS